jgi:hypothetical protein
MMSRDLFLGQGGFSTDFIGNIHEDVEFWARLCRTTDFYFIEEPLVQYRFDLDKWHERQGGESNHAFQNTILLYHKLMDVFGTDRTMRKHIRREVLKRGRRVEAGRHGKIGTRLAARGDTKGARRSFRNAWSTYKGWREMSRYLRGLLPGRFHKYLFKE